MAKNKKELLSVQDNTYQTIRNAVLSAKNEVYTTVNFAMVEAYWEIGKSIVAAQGERERAGYGTGLLAFLAKKLTAEFGNNFDESNLRRMRQFYISFPIRDALRHELSWTHYRLLMKIDDIGRRNFYLSECVESNWSARQLERQINTFFYERLLATQKDMRDSVKGEIQTAEIQTEPKYVLKDPYILEFLGLKENKAYHEKDIEKGLIDSLQSFLLELGRGFSFIARQKRITIDGDHYYVDLVFYNYILKCFVLIDLKADKLTYQDIGQIDFYVRYFEKEVRQPTDNPTIGIVLCSEKNDTMVKFSVMDENKQLFASKYMLYIPSESELKAEIERERKHLERDCKE